MSSLDLPNPFVKSIVADAWETPEADTPLLHAEGYETCRAALEQVAVMGRSRSVLLRGQPGSGKTHLLARLRQSVEAPQADMSADPPSFDPPQAAFSFIRLQTNARSLARHVRRTLVEDLLRPGGGPTPLEWMFLLQAKEQLHKPEKFRVWWLSLRWPERRQVAEEQVEELLTRFDRSLHLGRNLCAALRQVVLNRRRREASDWLRDGELPDAVREELGMTPASPNEDPEEDSLSLIRKLARLAGTRLPIVICFDQIEALQTHPGDLTGLFAFGRLVSSLHDQTKNLLLISCIQSTFNEMLRRGVREADMDRLAEEAALLKRPRWDEAEELLARRMDANPELAALRFNHAGRLWPLPADTLRELVAKHEYTPRRLIAWCKAEFERLQTGEAKPPRTPEEFLQGAFAAALAEAALPAEGASAEETLMHGLPLAWSAGGWGEASADPEFADVDLMLEGESGRTYVSVCNSAANRLTNRLERLRRHVEADELDHLVLVRDADRPLSENAVRAHEHLQALEQAGAMLIRPSRESLEQLEAVRRLLSAASTGDLSNAGDTVSFLQAQEWIRENLPDALRVFLAEAALGRDRPKPQGTTLAASRDS